MKLVLAEKPSVAQSIAKVLGAAKREDGYLEGNGYVVSWCVGHLVELAQPEVYDAKYSKWAYTIYQIVDLLVDTCATNRKLLHIAGDDKPAEVVRSRFMKLNADHIRFVLKCLAENSSPIRNMKQYLLASLYNAPTTMQLTYQNRTNHDFAHGSPRR